MLNKFLYVCFMLVMLAKISFAQTADDSSDAGPPMTLEEKIEHFTTIIVGVLTALSAAVLTITLLVTKIISHGKQIFGLVKGAEAALAPFKEHAPKTYELAKKRLTTEIAHVPGLGRAVDKALDVIDPKEPGKRKTSEIKAFTEKDGFAITLVVVLLYVVLSFGAFLLTGCAAVPRAHIEADDVFMQDVSEDLIYFYMNSPILATGETLTANLRMLKVDLVQAKKDDIDAQKKSLGLK